VNPPSPITRGIYGWALALGCAGLLYALRGVLTPMFVAFALAYLLDPLVDRLQRLHVPRVAGVVLLLVLALGALGLGLLMVLPAVVRDVAALAGELPAAVNRVLTGVQPWLAAHGLEVPRSGGDALGALAQNLQEVVPDAVGLAQSVGKVLLGGTASAIGAVATAIMVPVLAFYLLRDFDHIVSVVIELLPAGRREVVVGMGHEVHLVLGQFVRGQLTVMAILALLYASGYALVGVRLAVPIGLVAGLFSFIPYVGGALALGLGLLMTALHFGGFGQLIGVLVVYATVQTLDGVVITPRIVGHKLGLPAVWVLLALMAGGELFGFLGVMLALPTAAVVKVFAGHALQRYRASALYGGRAASVRTAGAGALAPVRARARLRLRRKRSAVRRGVAQ
jgi:predicted PurR-regulated permease PerM